MWNVEFGMLNVEYGNNNWVINAEANFLVVGKPTSWPKPSPWA